MINLSTPTFSVILGVDELERQAPKDAIAAALVISSYPLTDHEAATNFTQGVPGEASIDKVLLESISNMPAVVPELGLRMVLVKWKDSTESLVGFPIEDTTPSPALLKRAYRHGYNARRLRDLLAERAKEGRDG